MKSKMWWLGFSTIWLSTTRLKSHLTSKWSLWWKPNSKWQWSREHTRAILTERKSQRKLSKLQLLLLFQLKLSHKFRVQLHRFQMQMLLAGRWCWSSRPWSMPTRRGWPKWTTTNAHWVELTIPFLHSRQTKPCLKRKKKFRSRRVSTLTELKNSKAWRLRAKLETL